MIALIQQTFQLRLTRVLRVDSDDRLKLSSWVAYEFPMKTRYCELYRALVFLQDSAKVISGLRLLQNGLHVIFIRCTCSLSIYSIEHNRETMNSLAWELLG